MEIVFLFQLRLVFFICLDNVEERIRNLLCFFLYPQQISPCTLLFLKKNCFTLFKNDLGRDYCVLEIKIQKQKSKLYFG